MAPGDELRAWARDLEQAIRRTPKQTVRVVRKGSNQVKLEARRNVKRTAPVRNANAQSAINWDVEARGVEVVGEIGYDKSIKPGRLGNLLEFGGGDDHSPPHHDLARALAREEPKMTEALADMGHDLPLGLGKRVAKETGDVDGDSG